jgi:hypothetical protein
MPRLTPEEWERAKVEYEVNGTSFSALGKAFGVNHAAVLRRARAEGWEQGKITPLVERKASVVREMAKVTAESHNLPVTYQEAVERAVRAQVEEEEWMAAFGRAIAKKGIEILRAVKTPEQFETMTRSRKNLSPPRPQTAEGNRVELNVQQNQQTNANGLPQELAEIFEQLEPKR